MKRISYAVALLLVITTTTYADMDVLSAGGDVYMAWSAGAQSHLSIVGTDIGRTFSSSGISIGEIGSSFDHLVVTLYTSSTSGTDSLLVLDPLTLETTMSRRVELDDLLWPGSGNTFSMGMTVSRHNDSDSGIWVHATALVSDPGWWNFSVSARFVPDPAFGLVLDSSFYHGSALTYSVYSWRSRPFQCSAQDPPTMFFEQIFNLHSAVSYNLYSAVHQPDPVGKAEPMDCTIIGNFTCNEPLFLKAGGSCEDAILLLWTRTDSVATMCSTFDGLISPPVSTIDTGFLLDPWQPWAMSCNRQDPGLLLVWIEEDALMCRHYEEGWNQYEFQIGSVSGSVVEGDLAVCSDDDGYWIAWLEEEKADPDIVFVPRGSVTGISDADTQVPVQISVTTIFNPLQGVPLLQVDGMVSSGQLSVYDVSGRAVYETVLTGNGTFPLDITSNGVYFVRVSCGSSTASERFTLLN